MWKSLMILLALIGAATTTSAICTSNTQRELKRLAKQVNSGASIDSCVYDALEELPKSCKPRPRFLSEINNYFVKHNETDAMHELLRRQLGAFMDNCRGYFEGKVSEAVRKIGKTRVEEFREFVDDDYILQLFGSHEGEVVDSFSAASDRLLEVLEPMVSRYMKKKDHFDLLKDNISKEKQVKLVKSVASKTTMPCASYFVEMKPVVKKIRKSMVVAGNEQSYKLSSFSNEFQVAIFRYRLCEYIKSSGPRKLVKNMKELEDNGIHVANLTAGLVKRSGALLAILAIGSLILIGFCCLVHWLLKKSKGKEIGR